jgi:hypothetical protein
LTHGPLVVVGPHFHAHGSAALVDRLVYLLLRVEVQRGLRSNHLQCDSGVLKLSNVSLFHRLTFASAPTISGILTLATLPEEMITTRKMPSGCSGRFCADTNRLWEVEGPA